jgi:hypothetical protein
VRAQRLAKAAGRIVGSDTLGATLAGMSKGDVKSAVNAPFAMATYPATSKANPLSSTGTQAADSLSLVKTPKDDEKKGKKIG